MAATANDIVVFGGTFDPVHHGHLIVARAVLEELDLSNLTFLPTNVPPHKEAPAAGAEHRLAMLKLASRGEPRFAVSDIELRRKGRSYTIETVARLRAENAGARIRWVIGSDMLAELHKWREIDRLLETIRFVILDRAGVVPSPGEMLAEAENRFGAATCRLLRESIVRVPRIEISSSQVRERAALGLAVRWLVPECVADYIESHGLYETRIA